MAKIVNIYEPVSDELIIDAELAEELRARATRNIWDVKKEGVLQVRVLSLSIIKCKVSFMWWIWS